MISFQYSSYTKQTKSTTHTDSLDIFIFLPDPLLKWKSLLYNQIQIKFSITRVYWLWQFIYIPLPRLRSRLRSRVSQPRRSSGSMRDRRSHRQPTIRLVQSMDGPHLPSRRCSPRMLGSISAVLSVKPERHTHSPSSSWKVSDFFAVGDFFVCGCAFVLIGIVYSIYLLLLYWGLERVARWEFYEYFSYSYRVSSL